MRLGELSAWRRQRDRLAASYQAARSTYLALQAMERERDPDGGKTAEPKWVLGPGYVG